MPCRSYEDDFPQLNPVPTAAARIAELERQRDKLTAMLCHVSANLIERNYEEALSTEVVEWYKEHRAADLRNMQNLISNVELSDLSKADFDALDAILNKYNK